jgi:hypothetical protein
MEHGAVALAAQARHMPALLLADALTNQREFWEQVRVIQNGDQTPEEVAQRYVRRDQGRRLELVAHLLRTAAAAPDQRAAGLLGCGGAAYSVNGEVLPQDAKRALKAGALLTFRDAGLRIARRGAGRCVALDCPVGKGALLANDGVSRDYCASCARRIPRKVQASATDAERELLTAAVSFVLGGQDRKAARRTRTGRPA